MLIIYINAIIHYSNLIIFNSFNLKRNNILEMNKGARNNKQPVTPSIRQTTPSEYIN